MVRVNYACVVILIAQKTPVPAHASANTTSQQHTHAQLQSHWQQLSLDYSEEETGLTKASLRGVTQELSLRVTRHSKAMQEARKCLTVARLGHLHCSGRRGMHSHPQSPRSSEAELTLCMYHFRSPGATPQLFERNIAMLPSKDV